MTRNIVSQQTENQSTSIEETQCRDSRSLAQQRLLVSSRSTSDVGKHLPSCLRRLMADHLSPLQKPPSTSRNMWMREKIITTVCATNTFLPTMALIGATGLGKLETQFTLFHRNLMTISRVAETIGRSKDRLQHKEEIDIITDLVRECRKTLLKMLDCSRKYQNNEEYRPIFKLAVDYWCFEQNGKSLIDEWRKEMDERVSSIRLAISACQT